MYGEMNIWDLEPERLFLISIVSSFRRVLQMRFHCTYKKNIITNIILYNRYCTSEYSLPCCIVEFKTYIDSYYNSTIIIILQMCLEAYVGRIQNLTIIIMK